MGMTRQEAELITELSETMAKGFKVLEADVVALKREPFKPFRQKLKERNA